MHNAHIPPQYLQVSQTAGALYHQAKAYNDAVKKAATGASPRQTQTLQQEQDRLWLAYHQAKSLFDQHFPNGKTLPNRETIKLREDCASLLAQSRALLHRRISSAPAFPSSNGPGTPVVKTRPSPASRGGATSSTRPTNRRPLHEAEALLEALDELDPAPSPPSGMNSVSRPGSAGQYTFVAPEPDLTGAGRYSFVIPRTTKAIKAAASPQPKPELMRREPINSASRVLHNAMRYVDAVRQAGGGTRRVVNGESESGWDIALRRSAGARPSLQHASAARKRIRAAAAPAFAAALDRAVDAMLLQTFAAKHPGGVDAAKLRAAFAETANRTFAAEFVRLVGGQPPASAEDIALGAIIAVAIAQTTARFPIVPPEAVAPMAVLVHSALRSRLAELARMAAVIAAPSPAPRAAASAPAHEAAW